MNWPGFASIGTWTLMISYGGVRGEEVERHGKGGLQEKRRVGRTRSLQGRHQEEGEGEEVAGGKGESMDRKWHFLEESGASAALAPPSEIYFRVAGRCLLQGGHHPSLTGQPMRRQQERAVL
jgi:hypothetical protein